MYEAIQRQCGTQLRAAAGLSEPQDTPIAQAEIHGELESLRLNTEILFAAVGALAERLYPVLSGELNGVSGCAATQPVMNSPLGQSLRVENERLKDIASCIDSIRARVQL